MEREDLAHQLVLLVLQDKGKGELVGEIAEVEFGHRLAREPVVKPVDGRLEPLGMISAASPSESSISTVGGW